MTWRRHRTLLGVGACALLALALRAPYLHVPLGIDEGGIAAVARQWGSAHGSLYGADWLDRPPLLVLAFKLAGLGGPLGIRALGAAAAVALVAAVAGIAGLLGGRTAALGAGLATALLTGSAALAAVYTPGELLAAVPSSLSVLCLLLAHRRRELRWLVLAGLLAAAAALVKQSFLDAGLAGVVFLALSDRRVRLRWTLGYAGGLALPLALLAGWQATGHGGMAYALVGFRLDALRTLAHSGMPLQVRARKLAAPAGASGLAAALALAGGGLARLRGERVVASTLAAWLLGALVGVAGGGSYWPHYLIQAVPAASVLAALALAGLPTRVRGAIAAVAVVPALVVGVGAAAQAHRAAPHRTEAAIGDYVQDRAARGDTQYVLYARADVGYYTGLPSPYPYAWSLMVRAIPGARARLRRTLAGPARPTWVIRWQSPRRWGLDPAGALARLLRREYRPVATFGGHQVLLRRGVSRPGHNRRRCPRPTRTAGAASTAATRTRPTGRRPRWSCSTT